MRGRQRGVALFVTLTILSALMLLALAGRQLTLQAERMARNDRDRTVARIAADAALRDAMADIAPPGARRDWLTQPLLPDAPCGAGAGNPLLGLCAGTEPDFDTVGVTYGAATGATLQTGAGPLPARPPRYAIVAGMGNTLQLLAIGYGARATTRVRLARTCTRLPQPAC
jgi:type IV pilus assembly protein PilX